MPKSNLTSMIYHYTSDNGLFGIIQSSSFHCTSIKFLNDPSENIYFNEILNEVLDKNLDFEKAHELLYDKGWRDSRESSYDKYIISFSKNSDSLSMWNYYALGKGYCIGFEINELIKSINLHHQNINIHEGEEYSTAQFVIHEINIVYDRKEQIGLVNKFAKEAIKLSKTYKESQLEKVNSQTEEASHHAEMEMDHIGQTYTDQLLAYASAFKHSAYEREEEIRLMISVGGWEGVKKNYKVSNNGVIVEYIISDFLANSCIKEVIIHPINSESEIHEIGLRQYLNNSELSKVEIKSSKIPFREI